MMTHDGSLFSGACENTGRFWCFLKHIDSLCLIVNSLWIHDDSLCFHYEFMMIWSLLRDPWNSYWPCFQFGEGGGWSKLCSYVKHLKNACSGQFGSNVIEVVQMCLFKWPAISGCILCCSNNTFTWKLSFAIPPCQDSHVLLLRFRLKWVGLPGACTGKG